jgi:hypothetical protein
LGAKRYVPAVSLGTLFLAVQFADLLWPALVNLGAERFIIDPGNTEVTPLAFVSYPYSHSLVMTILWGNVVAVGYYALAKQKQLVAALVVAGLVVSHWVLDVISHRPDMPLIPGVDWHIGLGLWHSRVATILVETSLMIGGVLLYLKTTRPLDRTGVYAFWGLIGFLFMVSTANMYGPPPPNIDRVVSSAHALWLIVAWGYWIDRHRVPIDSGAPEGSMDSD